MSTLLIDTPAADAPRAAAFWSAALGATARTPPDEEQFTDLDGAFPDLVVAVQSVDDAPRYHIDIETDDVEAETARLILLGAVQIGQWLECHILRVPGDLLLCVIPRHSDDATFDRLAQVWE